MARVRRLFVRALAVDAVLVSHLLLAGMLHATSRHADGDREMTPFLLHGGHAVTLALGSLSYSNPSTSMASHVLTYSSWPTFIADAVAVALHYANAHSALTFGECAVYTVLSIALALSSLHVYWTAVGEFGTFGELLLPSSSQP